MRRPFLFVRPAGRTHTLRQLGDASAQLATTAYTYDNYGNVLTLTDPMGAVSEWTYDVMGNPLVHTDRRGKLWTNSYDAAGNLTATEDPLGNTTSLVYDGVGNLSTVTDADTFTTTFEYDARDNRVAVVDALDGRTEFVFDGNDQPVSTTDASNKRINTTVYDISGRVVSLTDGASNEIVNVYGNTSLSSNGSFHQANTISYPSYVQNQEFDRRDRLSRTIDHLGGGVTRQTLYGYDAAGRLTSVTDAKGQSTQTPRDALMREQKCLMLGPRRFSCWRTGFAKRMDSQSVLHFRHQWQKMGAGKSKPGK